MPRGGARIGSGRKTGTSDKALGKIRPERVLNATGTGPDKTPLAYMLAVMNNSNEKSSIRLQAAMAAAPYVHPRLASIEVKAENNTTLQIESDLGKALRELAEIARLRGPTIEGEVLEPATLEKPDILSTGHFDQKADIMTAGHFVQAPDILSNGGHFVQEPDILTEKDGDLDLP